MNLYEYNSKKRIFIQVLLSTFLVINLLPIPSASGAIKAGSKCKKVGQTSLASGVKYNCVKRANKLVWSKSDPKKISENKFEYVSACDIDPNSPAEWRDLEIFLSKITCTSFYKFVPYVLPSTKPNTILSNSSELLDIAECKIEQPSGQYYPWRGFVNTNNSQMYDYFKKYASPRPVMTIQLMPISWPDLPYSGSPKMDYGRYLTFLKSYVENISDVPTSVSIRIPDSYFTMPNSIDFYSDISEHGQPTPNRKIFWNDAIKATDTGIDYSGVTLAILVVAPNTPIDKFGSNPDGNGVSREGDIPHILSLPPLNTKVIHRNSLFSTPQMMIHELSHAGLDMGDYYNTGIWSHVGVGRFDPLGWDKYISGFYSDSQVYCVSPESNSTHWIVPSAVNGAYKKLVVVPLSKQKVLIAESMRSAGYKYKLPKDNQGVLIYTVDVSVTNHGDGTDVYRAQFKTSNKRGQEDTKYDAPLKQGESSIVGGVKISVVESGEYGDVIKVSKS